MVYTGLRRAQTIQNQAQEMYYVWSNNICVYPTEYISVLGGFLEYKYIYPLGGLDRPRTYWSTRGEAKNVYIPQLFFNCTLFNTSKFWTVCPPPSPLTKSMIPLWHLKHSAWKYQRAQRLALLRSQVKITYRIYMEISNTGWKIEKNSNGDGNWTPIYFRLFKSSFIVFTQKHVWIR